MKQLKIIPLINKIKKLNQQEMTLYSIAITKILIEKTNTTNKEIKTMIKKTKEKIKEIKEKKENGTRK